MVANDPPDPDSAADRPADGVAADGVEDSHEDAGDNAPPSLIARLIASWMGLSMKMSGGHAAFKGVTDAGMTLQQIAAIHILMFEGPVSLTSLSERLGLSASATSHLVQRLFELGYVSRFEDE